MSFEDITILVPTWNRSKFLPLFLLNVANQSYPKHHLKIIIDDDGTEAFIKNIDAVRAALGEVELTYITGKPRRSIGKKRHDLIKACKTKVFCFVDDDDIYLPTYIEYSYNFMKEGRFGCVGSNKMLFTMSSSNYDIHMIDCGDKKGLIHEACVMATTKWYKGSCGFANSSLGEGAQLFAGQNKLVGITDVRHCMICLEHSGNTVDKLQFAKEENKINIELSEPLTEMIDKILND